MGTYGGLFLITASLLARIIFVNTLRANVYCIAQVNSRVQCILGGNGTQRAEIVLSIQWCILSASMVWLADCAPVPCAACTVPDEGAHNNFSAVVCSHTTTRHRCHQSRTPP